MMNIDFITATVLDGAFAAVAAIGFAIISNPPRKAILISAFLAAVGHGLRYFLMHAHLFTMDIATASFFAAVSIGLLASLLPKRFTARQRFSRFRLSCP